MRSLAHIEQIENIRPIEGCDNIAQCNVLGWNLIIKKDEFNVGDKCVYIEIDSIVPSDMECFQFLEKKHFKVKSIRMRKTISQGIALPLTIFEQLGKLIKNAETHSVSNYRNLMPASGDIFSFP